MRGVGHSCGDTLFLIATAHRKVKSRRASARVAHHNRVPHCTGRHSSSAEPSARGSAVRGAEHVKGCLSYVCALHCGSARGCAVSFRLAVRYAWFCTSCAALVFA